MFDQQIQCVKDGLQKLRWQLLRFIEHDDATGQAVQLAAARGFGGEKGFEQLHVGGDDERRIPVFAGKAAACGFVPIRSVSLAVMFY